MTTLDEQFRNDENFNNWQKNHNRGRIIGGLFIIGAALLFFLKELGAQLPHWLFSWPMILIAVGLVSGIKHNFKNRKWLILILIGGVFLFDKIFPIVDLYRFQLPIILFLIGVVLIFKKKHHRFHLAKYKYRYNTNWNVSGEGCSTNNTDDFLLINNVFGGVKRSSMSKDFKGGDINNTFGGTELNLMQCQIQNEAVINIHNTFGGVKLIIPANWVIKSDIPTIFGGVEDERGPINANSNDTKTLVLTGSVFMGGVEIVSY